MSSSSASYASSASANSRASAAHAALLSSASDSNEGSSSSSGSSSSAGGSHRAQWVQDIVQKSTSYSSLSGSSSDYSIAEPRRRRRHSTDSSSESKGCGCPAWKDIPFKGKALIISAAIWGAFAVATVIVGAAVGWGSTAFLIMALLAGLTPVCALIMAICRSCGERLGSVGQTI